MKRLNRITAIAIGIALFALGAIAQGLVGNVGSDFLKVSFIQSSIWVVLIILSIIGGILVIVGILHEKRVNKLNNDEVTTVAKDITVRFNLREGPVTINAPDIKTTTRVLEDLQTLLSLEDEAHRLSELSEQQHKASDVTETKENEEHGKTA